MKNRKIILIVGSSNTDMVIKTDHLPQPGETILGGEFFMNAGGKGANQAVAAARLGGNVAFICKTGKDSFGIEAEKLFRKEGINTDHMISDPELASGIALIMVDSKGENAIAVASGANGNLTQDDISGKHKVFDVADIVLMQLEIPIDTVLYVASELHKRNKMVVLNPAPATQLPKDLLKYIHIITPNENEAGLLSGIEIKNEETAWHAAGKIREMGVENVIITLGSRGALIYNSEIKAIIPSPKVHAVDTTAAGDTFNGALVVALAEGIELTKAVTFACKAAAISVTRNGAQSSVPCRAEVDIFADTLVNNFTNNL